MKICLVEDCLAPYHAHGYCSVHAARLRRTGSPTGIRRTTTLDSFWRRVDKTAPGDCWIWTGYVGKNGYGSLASRLSPVPSGTRLVHRVSWELANGKPIPEGLHVDHLCRVTTCVNPDHLEPVGVQENVRRGLHGELRTHCKYGHELTPENTQYDAKRNCRRCRTCARTWGRRAHAKKVAKKATAGVGAGR